MLKPATLTLHHTARPSVVIWNHLCKQCSFRPQALSVNIVLSHSSLLPGTQDLTPFDLIKIYNQVQGLSDIWKFYSSKKMRGLCIFIAEYTLCINKYTFYINTPICTCLWKHGEGMIKKDLHQVLNWLAGEAELRTEMVKWLLFLILLYWLATFLCDAVIFISWLLNQSPQLEIFSGFIHATPQA